MGLTVPKAGLDGAALYELASQPSFLLPGVTFLMMACAAFVHLNVLDPDQLCCWRIWWRCDARTVPENRLEFFFNGAPPATRAPMEAGAAALHNLYVEQGNAGTDFSGIIRFLRGA